MDCLTCNKTCPAPLCTQTLVIGQAVATGTYTAYITNTLLQKTVFFELGEITEDANISIAIADAQDFFTPNFIYTVCITAGGSEEPAEYTNNGTTVTCLQFEFSELLSTGYVLTGGETFSLKIVE